jgi:hypothetical protein
MIYVCISYASSQAVASLVVLTPVNKSGTMMIYAGFLMLLPKLLLSAAVDLTWSHGHTLTTLA